MNSVLLFIGPFKEGGSFIYPIFFCFLVSLFFIVSAFIKRNKNLKKSKKMTALAAETSLLGLVIGCLGSVTGLIEVFDNVEYLGDISPESFSGGLKVTLLTITLGLASFILIRIGIILLKWIQTEGKTE